MKMQLAPGAEPVGAASAIFRGQVAAAKKELRRAGPRSTGAGLHEARKRLKRARATLRLLRDALGEAAYRRENDAVRDAARLLSAVRDAEVLLPTVDALAKHSFRARRPLREVRAALARRSAITRSSLLDRRHLQQVRTALLLIERRARHRKPGDSGWSTIRRGLRRTYRQGMKARKAACIDASPGNLHEWRKQAKYLWHQLQLLESLSPAAIGVQATQLHRLSDLLGEDHDLAVLQEQQELARLAPNPAQAVRAAIDQRRAGLQRRAFAIGKRLYRRKPKVFARRVLLSCTHAG